MLLDDDKQVLESVGTRFIEEIEKELAPLVSAVGDDIKAFGFTEYRSLTLVYYDYCPRFVPLNIGQDWTYDCELTEKENVNNVIRLIMEKVIKHGINSSLDKLSVYQDNSYLSKNYNS